MGSVTRTKQRGRAQRKDAIVRDLSGAVERLYAAGAPYTKLSVETLVKEAGLSRTTFYVYFEDKGDLLYELAEQAVDELVDTTRGWWELPSDATRDDLRAALRHTYEVHVPHCGVMASVVEVSSYDPIVRERYDELVTRSISEAARHIREGIKEGVVNPDLDPDRTAAWLCWTIERGDNEMARPDSGLEFEAWLDGLTGIIWNTLYRGVR